MTPTEIEKINREFAEKVMGWTYDHSLLEWRRQNEKSIVYWYDSDGVRQLPVNGFDAFDPYHRIDHAWLGLEKFPMCTVRKDKKLHQAMVRPWSSYTFYSEWVDTAPAAITLACIEAKKEEE